MANKKIYFNKAAAEAEIRARKEYIDRINEFAQELAFEMITLTNEILSKFVNEGTAYLSKLLIQETVKQYQKANIQVNSVMYSTLAEHSSAIASRFAGYQQPIRATQMKSGTSSDLVNILDDGKAVFNETERRSIEEKYTIYLTKEKEPLYAKVCQTVETLNQLDEEFKREGLDFMDCMGKVMSGSSFELDQNLQSHPRADLFMIRNPEGKLEPGSTFFE